MEEPASLRQDILLGADGTHPLRNKLRKRIRDRVEKCDVPDHWLLKEGESGLLSLDHRYFDSKYAKHITIRQALFQLTYRELPPLGRIIRMKCEKKRCTNPTHFEVTGWKPPYDFMQRCVQDCDERTYNAWYLRQREAPVVGRKATFNAP